MLYRYLFFLISYEEGIVPGGGSALLFASKKLEALKLENLDQQVGVDAIKAAMRQRRDP